MKQNNRGVLTAIDHNGFTCAHIAAMKVFGEAKPLLRTNLVTALIQGSLAVVKELMMIDKAMVIQAKTKTLEVGHSLRFLFELPNEAYQRHHSTEVTFLRGKCAMPRLPGNREIMAKQTSSLLLEDL